MSSQKSYQTLKAIWDKVSKPDAKGLRFIVMKRREDIIYLYCTGFVDESQHNLKSWLDSFHESLGKDTAYYVSEAQWMDKVRFHYSGPVEKPFDALAIREGTWTEVEMEKLIQEQILPATYFSEKEFRMVFDEAKRTFFTNGVYQITAAVKKDLKELLEMYPSPAQVRALGLLEARLEAHAPAIKSPSSLAQGQRSSTGVYQQGPSPSQVAAQKLSDILSKTGGRK